MSKRKPNKGRTNSGDEQPARSSANKGGDRGKTSGAATNWKSITPKDKVTLVIPCYNESARVSLLADGIKRFDKQWGAKYELIIVDDGSSDETIALLEEKLSGLANATHFEIVALGKNQGKGNALKAGVAKATGDFILTLDADMATEPMEMKKWLASLPNAQFSTNEILIGSREHSKSKVEGRVGRRIVGLLFNLVTQLFTSLTVKDTQCGFKLYPAEIGKQLFANMKVKGWAHDVELLYKGQLNGMQVRSMPVAWKHVDETKIKVLQDGISMVFMTIITAWRIKLDWFILQPIKELGKAATAGRESSIYRLLFVVLTLGLLVLMPMLSGDYGVTGDEYVQKVYGEMVNEHFETDGAYLYEGSDSKYKGQNALTMTPNLWYYGGYFDYLAAKVYSVTGADEYETRHLLNALVGFLLMFFTGLLGKEISGSWKIGFLSLLMVALSPRIFGHSFNNPKDIPFAAAYIFTLLNLIRFVKQLPNPGAKTIIYLILGIGASIGIRIGGLLLVAYLGLFTAVAFLWEKQLRRYLLNIPTLIKVAFYGAIAALFGYLLGLLFWPFGQASWIDNPMEALAEMSNFDTAIQMLYEGNHTWSDQLPWYYIPKWMLMTAPVAVVLGIVLFLPMLFLNKKKNLLWLGLTVFAAIFPPAYAIYQESALYDGMRHFLFIYPVLVVIGAYGWEAISSISTHKMVNLASIVVPVLLLALPLKSMLNNHPYEYTYINELYGGTNAAKNTYETDYWMISVKPLVEWAVENIPEIKAGKEVTIYMSNQVEAGRHYFSKLAPNVRVMWQRYAERDKKDNWEYAILFNRFMDVGHLKSGAWPPYKVLHEEKADDVVLGVVCKKESNKAGEGRKAFTEGRYPDAIKAFEEELKIYPKNEIAWLGLADAASRIQDYTSMKKAVDGAVNLSPTHVNSVGMKGFYFYNAFEASKRTNPAAPNVAALDSAIVTYEEAIRLNYKYVNGYYFLAFCYANKGDNAKIFQCVENLAENNANLPQAYDLGIQTAQRANDQVRMKYFQARKALATGNGQQGYQLGMEVFRMNPRYEPGAKFKIMLDELVAKQQKQQLEQQQQAPAQ